MGPIYRAHPTGSRKAAKERILPHDQVQLGGEVLAEKTAYRFRCLDLIPAEDAQLYPDIILCLLPLMYTFLDALEMNHGNLGLSDQWGKERRLTLGREL